MLELLKSRELQLLASFTVSIVISVTAIPVIITISKLKDLMAEIELRSSHEQSTPTLGGVAIFASTLIGYFLWDNPNEGHELHLSVSALIILFFLGIKDDILILSPKKKLLIQIASSLMLITLGDVRINNLYGLFGITEIPYVISLVFTTFIFISVINAINLLDGIDGLAGMVGILSSLIFAWLFYDLKLYSFATMAVSLGGALIGFLRFNWSKKNKIFMGDTGSLIVGFLLSFFAVKYIVYNSQYLYNPALGYDAPMLTIIILILPLFDTLRMFTKRILSGQSPFVGDRNHLHHLLIDNGLSHQQATIALNTFALLVFATFQTSRGKYSNNEVLVVLFVLFVAYCTVAHLLSKNLEEKSKERAKFQKIDKIKRLQLVEEKKKIQEGVN